VKRAKYLFVTACEGHSWGGSEALWSSAAEKLARSGNEVRISVKDWGKVVPQIEHLRLAGCQVFYRRPPSFIARQARKLIPLPEYPHAHIVSVGKDVDLIVISQGANADGLGWVEAARASGFKYAIIAQAAAEQWWPVDEVAERLSVCYEAASAAYFVSQANLDLSRRQFSSPIWRGKVIRNPFNVSFNAQPPWPVDPSREFSLACVGRLDVKAKGQDLILEVLRLPHWRERNVRLSLVGNGVNERGLRRLAEQAKLSDVVKFTGYVNDIEGLWRTHHALLLPSRYEGMPLAIVEAMLCGRPCIVTDVAGHKELVRDGVNGFLAKAPTVELLDEAMNRAWEARHRLKEMGDVAAADVRKWVSKDPAEDFVNELLSLVESARP
jgi:glycosyltransferase involved in cell wall biosynthesis